LPEKKPRFPHILFTCGLPFGGANVGQKHLRKKGLRNKIPECEKGPIPEPKFIIFSQKKACNLSSDTGFVGVI
jgi:hypothetical protein